MKAESNCEGDANTSATPGRDLITDHSKTPLHWSLTNGLLTVTVGMDEIHEIFARKSIGIDRASGSLGEGEVLTALFNGVGDDPGVTPWEKALFKALGDAHDYRDDCEARWRREEEETLEDW
jgi:hypothetical protein